MPITRYEIRNEYSLADPELYRAADKDDPEALLEGVAMAGLVGVLRQLGDLAEFAAEIFHDLHEEVMVTAARGHGLMTRVQQLESEVTPIERALLSQTDHSSFFFNAGVDWHPNPRMEQNLITQGDLPRFVMDSYEECRGPPRLFLLDKFDVAGAGSCLKRYTDPSFFKEGNSVTIGVDVQREKKSRRSKKRGQRWRNGETPELLPASHTKLHQLFLEERVENGVSNPARRVKLKRRPNGFPFGSKNGKSYMEKILKNPSPEHKLREVIPKSPILMLPVIDYKEFGFDVRDVCGEQDEDEIRLNSSKHEMEEVSKEDIICDVTRCESGEKDIAVDGEFKTEGSLAGYQSDDVASEIDYVDAPSTMESEMDTDSEMRVKRDVTSSFVKTQLLISDADEDDLHTRSSDSQSTTESVISDERHNSSKKETSSFSTSDSPTTSAENTNSVTILTEAFPSIAIHETQSNDNALIYQKTAEEDSLHQKPMTDIELVTSNICFTDLIPSLEHLDADSLEHLDAGVVETDRISEPYIDDVVLASEDREGKMNLIMDQLYTPSVSESPGSSAGKNATDEANVPHTLAVSDCTDNFIAKSSDIPLHEVENISSSSDSCNVILQKGIDTSEAIPVGNVGIGKLNENVPQLTEISWSSRRDKARNENETVLTVSKEEKQNDVMDNLNSNAFNDGPECVSCTMEDYHGREPFETSLSSSHHADPGENFSKSSIGDQISSENLILPLMENCPELQGAEIDACGRPIFAGKETSNEIPPLGTSETCAVVGLLGTDLGGDLESSSAASEDLEELSGGVDTLEIDLTTSSNNLEVEVDEESHSPDLLFSNGTHVSVGECANEIVKLETDEMGSAEHTFSDIAYEKPFNSPDVLKTSDMEEHKNVENCVLGIQSVQGRLEELPHKFDSISDVGIIICNSDDDNDHEPLAEDNVQSLYHDLDVEDEMDTVDAINIVPTLEENGLCTEQEVSLPSLYHNSSSVIDIASEERVFQEKIELPPSQFTEEFAICGEISSGSSPVSPIKTLEHENSGFMFQHVISPSPPLFPQNPVQSGFDIFLPSNLVSQENQINLDELPPLPPLPPVQWRIGKLQLASPLTNGTVRQNELSPQVTLPSIGSTNVFHASHADFNHSTIQSPPKNAEADVEISLTLANTTNETISLHADTNLAMVQVSPETTETKVEESLRTLVNNAMNTTIDVHEDFSFDMVKVSPEISEKEVEECSSSLVGNSTSETIEPHEDLNHTMFQVTPVTSEEIVEESDNSMNDTIDHQLEMGNELDQTTTSTNSSSSLETTNLPLIQNDLEITSKIEKFELNSFDVNCPKNDTLDVSTETELESENVHSSCEKINNSSIENPMQNSSRLNDNPMQSSSRLNDNPMHEIVNLQPKIEIIEQRKLTMPFLLRDSTPPADENSVTNGSQKVKLPRPRNPLVEDVTVLDKSKLRKVTERVIPQMKQVDERDSFLQLRKVVRPQIPQVDERDSLLQQIRTKSFNLKPAMTSRPSIRGPRTNLKVTAILEKANAIRQAVGGSDEDDDDNWSDS